MKPTATLRRFLCIASSVLLCISYAHAADVTWDITPGTVSLGDSLNTPLGNSALSQINIGISAVAIPEPNVAALLGGLGMLALLRRCRN